MCVVCVCVCVCGTSLSPSNQARYAAYEIKISDFRFEFFNSRYCTAGEFSTFHWKIQFCICILAHFLYPYIASEDIFFCPNFSLKNFFSPETNVITLAYVCYTTYPPMIESYQLVWSFSSGRIPPND